MYVHQPLSRGVPSKFIAIGAGYFMGKRGLNGLNGQGEYGMFRERKAFFGGDPLKKKKETSGVIWFPCKPQIGGLRQDTNI